MARLTRSGRPDRRCREHCTAWPRILAGEGFIYVAEVVGAPIVKIGFSLNPENRVRTMWPSQHGKRYALLAKTPGTLKQEQQLHRELSGAEESLWHEYYHRSILQHPAIPADLRAA